MKNVEPTGFFDIHVHSRFSPDGKSDVKEYIDLIDNGKLKAVGFAEHLDFLPECGAYGFLDYANYTSEIGKYKAKGYQVYAAAEVDYAISVKDDIHKRLQHEKYDYTICSVHMINGLPVSDRNIEGLLNRDTFKDTITSYYNELKDGLATEVFDVMGHIGVFKRYITDEYYDVPGLRQWLMDLDHEMALICAASDKIIEVNTSGLYTIYKSTVPGELFLKKYYEAGGRRIAVSSDAHDAKHAGRGFRQARELLKDIGFDYIILPWDKEAPVRIV